MSWTPFEKIEQRSQDFALIDKVMNAQQAIIDSEKPNFRGLTTESRNNSTAILLDLPIEPTTWNIVEEVCELLNVNWCIVITYREPVIIISFLWYLKEHFIAAKLVCRSLIFLLAINRGFMLEWYYIVYWWQKKWNETSNS